MHVLKHEPQEYVRRVWFRGSSKLLLISYWDYGSQDALAEGSASDFLHKQEPKKISGQQSGSFTHLDYLVLFLRYYDFYYQTLQKKGFATGTMYTRTSHSHDTNNPKEIARLQTLEYVKLYVLRLSLLK